MTIRLLAQQTEHPDTDSLRRRGIPGKMSVQLRQGKTLSQRQNRQATTRAGSSLLQRVPSKQASAVASTRIDAGPRTLTEKLT